MIHKSLIYLACPYSDPDPVIRELRFEQVNAAAAVMMRVGLHVFSPISHCHPIAKVGALPLGWDYWESYDRAILKTCAALVVLMLPGWDKSTGVTGEIRIAKELDLPIFYVYRQECSPEWAGRLRAGLPGYEAKRLQTTPQDCGESEYTK